MSLPTHAQINTAVQRLDWPQVEHLCGQRLAMDPDEVDSLFLMGMALYQQRRFGEALPLYARLTELQPQVALHHANHAELLRELGQLPQAEALYRRALALDADNASTLLQYGLLLLQMQRFAEAREYLLDAHRADPSDLAVRLFASRACALCRDPQADQLLRGWQAWPPLEPALRTELADLFMTLGDAPSARQVLEGLLQQGVEDSALQIQLATVCERMNDLEGARRHLAQLGAPEAVIDPRARNELLHLQANLALREGDRAASVALLGRAGPRHALDYAHYFQLADIEDKQGHREAALSALAEAHRLQMTEMAQTSPARLEEEALILPPARYALSAAEYARWPVLDAPDASQSPIFIVGFPRSGTTMLEQMLDADPSLQSMDERPFFNLLADDLGESGLQTPDDLYRLGQRDCDELRRRYWALVGGKIRRDWSTRLVDKNPLNMLWLPLIHRLFPRAKFILALRHPCDVVWSCYMQNFYSNMLAAAARDLPHLATAYVTAMDYWLHHVELFKPDVYVSRYEDLVDDFAAGTARISDFLGLADAAHLRRFDEHARAKGYIATPSYAQVIQPVNRRAVNRWERYRESFAEALPILQPMLDCWGYKA